VRREAEHWQTDCQEAWLQLQYTVPFVKLCSRCVVIHMLDANHRRCSLLARDCCKCNGVPSHCCFCCERLKKLIVPIQRHTSLSRQLTSSGSCLGGCTSQARTTASLLLLTAARPARS
jgi:hypothetical protein